MTAKTIEAARVARGALDILRQRHARVLGLIFNAAVSSPCERQYYEPYARAYHWQPGANTETTAGTTACYPVPQKRRRLRTGKIETV